MVAVVAFFGLVATMDLRLLRVFAGEPAGVVVARIRPFAVAALFVIVAAGLILFSAEAVALARNPVFQLKVAAIVLALVNVVVSTRLLRLQGENAGVVRITAGLSLILWLLIAALGRTIAYV